MIRKMIRKMMRKMTNNRGFQELGETGQGVSRGTPGILVIKKVKLVDIRDRCKVRLDPLPCYFH